MKKVVITGAKGRLGQDLIKIFQADSAYQVISWDVEELDITDASRVEAKIKSEQPAIIINAAAYNAVDKAEEDEKEFELAKKINGKGPENLAKAAKGTGAVFVHYVSDYIFDGEKGIYTENDQPSPISNYGHSKALGEQKVQAVDGQYYLIRTSKLFGPPATSGNAKKSFFEVMLELAKKNQELKVVNGERSCFTYTPDLAQATKHLIEEKYPFGIYHLINEGVVTWYEGLKKLFKLLEIKDIKLIPVSPEEFPRPASRPASSILVNTRFPKLRNYEEALKDWISQQGK